MNIFWKSKDVHAFSPAANGIPVSLCPGGDSTAIPLIADEEFREQGPAISPDGRWLAYSSDETGRNEVFVRPFPDVDSGKWPVSTGGGVKPVWAHSGRELFYVDRNTNTMVVAEVQTDPTFQVVRRETLFMLPEGSLRPQNGDFYDVTSDDQRFLMARTATVDTEGPASEVIVVENFFEVLKRLVPTN